MYAYDNIGNRDTYTKGTGAQTSYETNNLNQYENVETASSPVTGQNLLYDADGNVTESYVVGDFDGDGSVGFNRCRMRSQSVRLPASLRQNPPLHARAAPPPPRQRRISSRDAAQSSGAGHEHPPTRHPAARA